MRYHAYIDAMGYVWIEDTADQEVYQMGDDDRYGWADWNADMPLKKWTLLRSDSEQDMNPFKSMVQQQTRLWAKAERAKRIRRPYVTL